MKIWFIFNDISTFLLRKKLLNFYTNIVGTIRLSETRMMIVYINGGTDAAWNAW